MTMSQPVPDGASSPEDRARAGMVKSLGGYSPYGYRGRIGMIVPSTNVVAEPEFSLMAPRGVSFHATRMMLRGKYSDDSFRDMARDTERCLAELATAEVDIIAWAGTSASLVVSMEALEAQAVATAGVRMISTTSAVLAALRAVAARRVVIGTPYVEKVTEGQVAQVEKEGFEVLASRGMGLGHSQEERRAIGRVPPQSLFRLVREIDRAEADTIFISCTNLATATVIGELEQAFGKPVVTSNQATLWACLRALGIRDRLEGYGRLFHVG